MTYARFDSGHRRRLLPPAALAATTILFLALAALPQRPLAADAKGMQVAVMPFTSAGAGAELADIGSALQSIVTTDLSQLSALKIVERARLKDIQTELKLSRSSAIDPKTAVKVGKLAGATHLVVGSFTLVGVKMRLDCRLLAVETGQVVLAETMEGEKDLFFELEKDLVKKLVSALAVKVAPRERAELTRVHTSDFLAFRKYGEGLALADDNHYQEAAAALRAAAGRDPEFKLAKITLEQYEELIIKLRSKTADVERASVDLKFVGEQTEAKRDAAIVDRLFAVVQKKSRPPVERLVAMFLLMAAYDGGGSYLTTLYRYADRFANHRTADALARSYFAEVPSVFPAVPLMYAYKAGDWINACRECVLDLKSIDGFEPALAASVRHMTSMDTGRDGKTPGHLRTEYQTDPFVEVDRYLERLNLDRREQATVQAQLLQLVRKRIEPKPSDSWFREQQIKLGKAYRRALELDRSTAAFLQASAGTDDASTLRTVTEEVQHNRDLAALVQKRQPRQYVEEYLRLYGRQNTASKDTVERLFPSAELTPKAVYELSQLREFPHSSALLIGGEPIWCVFGALATGHRPDELRSDELRYEWQSYLGDDADTLALGGTLRSDFTVRFRLDFAAPPDYWPAHSGGPGTRGRLEDRKLQPGQPEVTLVFGVRDVDAWLEDPHSHKYLRPTRGWALQLLPDRIRLARLSEKSRKDGSRVEKSFEFKTEEEKSWEMTAKAVEVSVRVDGGGVSVDAGGKKLRFRAPEDRNGFVGFNFHGKGFASVGQLRIAAAK